MLQFKWSVVFAVTEQAVKVHFEIRTAENIIEGRRLKGGLKVVVRRPLGNRNLKRGFIICCCFFSSCGGKMRFWRVVACDVC